MVPTGRPDETLKPATWFVPTGRPVDVEKLFNLLVWQGLPFLLNQYPQEHCFTLITIEVLHCGHTLYPFGPGFFSMSPHSKIRKYLINAIITNSTPFLPYRLHLDEQQILTLILKIPTTTLYCWISIIPVPVTIPCCRIAELQCYM